VCTGNICRSPFIERLLQLRLDQRWLDEGGLDERRPGRDGSDRTILVHSAGTGALTGWAMEGNGRRRSSVAHGGDPAGFRARALTPALIAESDLVLTATRTHRGKGGSDVPKGPAPGVHLP
jgi:protein-tyrosine phosphatase